MTYFFDNCLSPKISRGLKAFGEDVVHLLDYFHEDAKDTEILEFIGNKNMVLITKDERIRWNEAERKAIHKYKVGSFFLGGKNLNGWQIIEQVIRNWLMIKEFAETTNKPFAFKVPPHGKKITTLNL